MWAISAGICPIGSLLLLLFAPASPGTNPQWFGLFVGTIGIAFGLCSAVLIGRSVARPVDQLRAAAKAGDGRPSRCAGADAQGRRVRRAHCGIQ